MSFIGDLLTRKKSSKGSSEGADEQSPDTERSGKDPLIDRDPYTDDRYMNAAVATHNWQVAFRLVFALLVISVGFNCYNMTQSKYVPVVVGVDEFGTKIVVGPVTESKPVDLQRAIYREVRDFIEASRGIASDANYQKGMLKHVATRLRVGSSAAKIISELHATRPPYETGRINTIAIEDVVPLRQTEKTYAVEWTEVRRTASGEQLSSERWKALLTVGLEPFDDRDSVMANPLGFTVEAIDWSRVR